MISSPAVAWTFALLALACFLFPATARADDAGAPPRRTHLENTPCPGCLASLPDGTEPVPLIVALHGDFQSAAPVHDAWEKHAAPRGVAVLALACPTRLGCAGSYWRWNGAPAWIDEQVTKLAERRAIDRARLWLVGWSGGASYAGYRTLELERTFAAIVIHGGGMPPGEPACADAKASVYFLVGDKNPLHALSVRLRNYYDQCGNDVSWDLVRGAEHPGEWEALGTHGGAILAWLATKRRATKSAPVEADAALDAPAVPAPVSPAVDPPDARAPTPPQAVTAGRAMAPRGCGCNAASRGDGPASLGVAAGAVLLLAARRKSRVLLVAALAAVGCSQAPAAPRVAPPAAIATATTGDAAVSVDPPPPDAGVDAHAAIPVRRPGAYANLDPDDDYVVAPPEAFPECEAELARAGVTFKAASLPVVTQKRSKLTCGAPQVVTYLRGPGNIAYNAAPLLTCSMALALASFERILQQEATATFGSPVARIDQIGTYSCREVAAYPGLISEHSYANAIDIGRFVLKNGKSIEVLRDFDVSDGPPKKPAGAFLRAVSRRANDEDVFSHVLTPFFNATHKNHFHLDLARYRSDGTRP